MESMPDNHAEERTPAEIADELCERYDRISYAIMERALASVRAESEQPEI